MTKILVTVDGSEESRAVLPLVSKLAKQLNALVDLLNVAAPASGTRRNLGNVFKVSAEPKGPSNTGPETAAGIVHLSGEPPFAESKDQAIERSVAEATDLLSFVAKPLRDAGIAVDLIVIVDSDPAHAIVDYAKKDTFDFIAMSTHGRTGLRRVVTGSVASAVVSSGAAPVLLVHPTAS